MNATATKERPILFSGPMVKAILEGRKTQTRRVIKPQPERWNATAPGLEDVGGLMWKGRLCETDAELGRPPKHSEALEDLSPYGQPVDRLWVRETWALVHPWGDSLDGYEISEWAEPLPKSLPRGWRAWYAVDSDDIGHHPADRFVKRWRPSIFMPRWASRITLEITGVRVERLNDISEADAWAEGFPDPLGRNREYPDRARYWFKHLWDSINVESHAWASNPWVWVVSFAPSITPCSPSRDPESLNSQES